MSVTRIALKTGPHDKHPELAIAIREAVLIWNTLNSARRADTVEVLQQELVSNDSFHDAWKNFCAKWPVF